MNEIMEKTFELIDVLEDSDMMKDLEFYRDKVLTNEELQKFIQKGNASTDEYLKMEIKKKLYQNEDYHGYMEKYQELMYLVMEMNARFQKLIGKGSCFR